MTADHRPAEERGGNEPPTADNRQVLWGTTALVSLAALALLATTVLGR